VTLDEDAIQGFAAGVRGAVLRPGEQGYDDARAIWNGLIDRRPALIVPCTGAADVVDAVNFAREQNLLLWSRAAATTWPATRSTTAAWSSTYRKCVASTSTRQRRQCGRKAARPGATVIGGRSSSAWRCRAGSSRLRASPA
jgi:hypothetical protein